MKHILDSTLEFTKRVVWARALPAHSEKSGCDDLWDQLAPGSQVEKVVNMSVLGNCFTEKRRCFGYIKATRVLPLSQRFDLYIAHCGI